MNQNDVLPDLSDKQPVDGVEILVNLAKTGQIDPWNVDIVQVADEYLKAVADMKSSDLMVTGKVLLFLAILLRMKSDQLAGIDYLDPPEEDAMMDFLEEDDFGQKKIPLQSLDEVIKRRTSRKQHRIRQVTLTDLIMELKRYETLERKRSLKDKAERQDRRRNKMRDYSELSSDDIVEMAHEESIEDTILNLTDLLENILTGSNEVSLSELVTEGGIDRISGFLALLFLTARGMVDVHQEEFYSELYVSRDTEDKMEMAG